MNYGDVFSMMGSFVNSDADNSPSYNPEPAYQNPLDPASLQYAPSPMSWEEAYNGFKTRPILYNMDGWISAYSSNNWGNTTGILATIDEQYKLNLGEPKIDPNKIFSAEVSSLRTLSADQLKMLKMFEKKFAESITEKGKVGLTEEDIEAMAAITAARTALTNIEKEKVAIKKNIADLKIKQNQNNNTSNSNGPAGAGSSSDTSTALLDKIFDSSAVNTYNPLTTSTYVNYEPAASTANVDPLALIDEAVPNVDTAMLNHENSVIYARVGIDDNDVSFEAHDQYGNIDYDYPADKLPTKDSIASVDRNNGEVRNNVGQTFKIIS